MGDAYVWHLAVQSYCDFIITGEIEQDRLSNSAALEDLAHSCDDFPDADRPIKNRGKSGFVGGVLWNWRECFHTRRDQNRGHALDKFLNSRVAGNFGSTFKDDNGGRLAGGEGAANVFC